MSVSFKVEGESLAPKVEKCANSILFLYPCDSHSVCFPYSVKLGRGRYLLEAWGASAGYLDGINQPGYGGYSSGILKILNSVKLYFFIGGQGKGKGLDIFQPGGFNGGGDAYACGSGGGATDIRTIKDNLYSRFLVAGGGGGASYYKTQNGGSGGGKQGKDGQNTKNNVYSPTGGSQTTIGKGGKSLRGIRQDGCNGMFGKGGSGCNKATSYGSGGGGGWYGGGGGACAVYDYGGNMGAGGSGFVLEKGSVLPKGYLVGPDYFLTKGNTNTNRNNSGNGKIRITFLPMFSIPKHHITVIFYFNIPLLYFDSE